MPAPELPEAVPSFILASGSPRRRDLLNSAGLTFDVDKSEVPEDINPGEAPRAYARRMAEAKGREVARKGRRAGDQRAVLAADTIVVVDDQVLGKPADRAEARQMIQALAGRDHQVITAFCLIHSRGEIRDEVITQVTFRPLNRGEIEQYLDAGEWTDKAGGYGIQGRAAQMVRRINGSYTNVVGLPLAEVVTAMASVLTTS